MAYRHPGQKSKGAIELYPVTGKKSATAAKEAGFSASDIPALLVEGDNRAGLGYATAQAIADAGARYNLEKYRPINVPTLALEYLASSFQMRTWYKKAGEETVSGVRAWRIAFEEIAVPTVIRTPEGNDVPARGIAWVEPGTGRVVRTQLEPQQPATLAAESILNKLTKPGPRKPEPRQESRIIVTYAPDSRFGVWVPLKLEESYKRAQVTVTGEAAYSDCRRFETTARVKNEDE